MLFGRSQCTTSRTPAAFENDERRSVKLCWGNLHTKHQKETPTKQKQKQKSRNRDLVARPVPGWSIPIPNAIVATITLVSPVNQDVRIWSRSLLRLNTEASNTKHQGNTSAKTLVTLRMLATDSMVDLFFVLIGEQKAPMVRQGLHALSLQRVRQCVHGCSFERVHDSD